MNKPAKIETVTVGVHRKLSVARQKFHALELRKTGKNTFAGYSYFELGDFLIPALKVFDEVGLGAVVSFDADTATMTICDLDNPDDRIVITSPMGSAALKGCHEVQNIGAVETYQRRYLWVAALEIVEHDALDKTTGNIAPETRSVETRRDAPFPPGPCKNKTELKARGRAYWADVMACGDPDELAVLRSTHKELETQLRHALPSWWEGGTRDDGPFEGLGQVIDRLERDFAGIAESGLDMRGRTVLDAG